MDEKHSTNNNIVCQCNASLHSHLCVAHKLFLRDKVNLLSNLHGSVQPQVIAAVFKEKWINDSVWNKIIPIFMRKSAILYYI